MVQVISGITDTHHGTDEKLGESKERINADAAFPKTISTERTTLRQIEASDIRQVFAILSKPEMMGSLHLPDNFSERHLFSHMKAVQTFDWKKQADWIITHESQVVGGIQILLSADGRAAEIGFHVSPDVGRRGIATEVAKAVIDLSFSNFPLLTEIFALTAPDNSSSKRVIANLGMTQQQRAPEEFVNRMPTKDLEIFSLSRPAATPPGENRERDFPEAPLKDLVFKAAGDFWLEHEHR